MDFTLYFISKLSSKLTRVFTVTEAQDSKINDVVLPTIIEQNNIQDPESKAKFAIDVEKTAAVLRRDEILKQLMNVVLNRTRDNASDSLGWKKFLLFSIIGILAPFIALIYVTLIPQSDLMRYPENWWEQPLSLIGVAILFAAADIGNCAAWMNLKTIQNLKNFVLFSLIGIIVAFAVWALGTLWWMQNGYFPPVPFSGLIAGYGVAVSQYLAIWFHFSKESRKIAEFRKRLKYFLAALILSQILTVQYNVIAKFLLEYKDNNQWAIALTLPLFIEFNSWIVNKLATKASGGDTRTVEVTSGHLMATRHALFLTYTLGSIATNLTANIILATDYLINLSLVIRLIRAKKKDPLNVEKQIDLLQDLVLNEMIEFVVPIAYVIVFASAYFGPNSTLIGNVGNSYFQYSKVENFWDSIQTIGVFFLVDVFSLISNTIILRIFAKISVFEALFVYVKEYGALFTINMTLIFFTVSILTLSIFVTQNKFNQNVE